MDDDRTPPQLTPNNVLVCCSDQSIRYKIIYQMESGAYSRSYIVHSCSVDGTPTSGALNAKIQSQEACLKELEAYNLACRSGLKSLLIGYQPEMVPVILTPETDEKDYHIMEEGEWFMLLMDISQPLSSKKISSDVLTFLQLVHSSLDQHLALHDKGLVHGDFGVKALYLTSGGKVILGDLSAATSLSAKNPLMEFRGSFESASKKAFCLSLKESLDRYASSRNSSRPVLSKLYDRVCAVTIEGGKGYTYSEDLFAFARTCQDLWLRSCLISGNPVTILRARGSVNVGELNSLIQEIDEYTSFDEGSYAAEALWEEQILKRGVAVLDRFDELNRSPELYLEDLPPNTPPAISSFLKNCFACGNGDYSGTTLKSSLSRMIAVMLQSQTTPRQGALAGSIRQHHPYSLHGSAGSQGVGYTSETTPSSSQHTSPAPSGVTPISNGMSATSSNGSEILRTPKATPRVCPKIIVSEEHDDAQQRSGRKNDDINYKRPEASGVMETADVTKRYEQAEITLDSLA